MWDFLLHGLENNTIPATNPCKVHTRIPEYGGGSNTENSQVYRHFTLCTNFAIPIDAARVSISLANAPELSVSFLLVNGILY